MKLFKRLREKPPEGDHILAIADKVDEINEETAQALEYGRKFAEHIRSYDADKRKEIMVLATIRAIPHDPIDAILEMAFQSGVI